MTAPLTDTRRVVLLVANTAAPYSRGLRLARSLAAAGWQVEIAAVTGLDVPDRETDSADGATVVIHRYRPSGPFARYAFGGDSQRAAQRDRGVGARFRRIRDLLLKAIAWPIHVRGWWRTLERELEPADVYHAFGILTVGIAERLAADARRSGRAGRVVYDVIDIILDSNNVAEVPAPLLAWYRWRERRWVRRADAVVTVNAAIASHLERIWRLDQPPTVLLNCQPSWIVPSPRPDLIRAATGLPPDWRVALFLGRLGRERGLDEAAEAVLMLPKVALVLLGFGPWADRLRERDEDPRFRGRHFTLPAVHPDDVRAWTASADVSVLAVPANSLNQRLSTPNKFWESLAAGTPMVLGRDLEVMRSIAEAEGVAVSADPADPEDIARALRAILEQPAEAYEAMRTRALELTASRYTWERAVEPYLMLIDRLSPASSASAASPASASPAVVDRGPRRPD